MEKCFLLDCCESRKTKECLAYYLLLHRVRLVWKQIWIGELLENLSTFLKVHRTLTVIISSVRRFRHCNLHGQISEQVEIKRTIPKGSAESKDFKTKKIFVGGIPTSVTEDEFKNFFSKYGKVVEHEIIRDHVTKRSWGFGFVVFDNEQVVDTILANGNMIDMEGSQVSSVQWVITISDVQGHSFYVFKPAIQYYFLLLRVLYL
ncbi:RNA-binding protein Musashi homolog 2-like [Camellia sinensis]|uniref:RNA-binding protein Musashi homolog 2-like n=1 Tax=Camellia sinensis TaxID=4442 RepID=UPI001036DA8C|nr:RNA-binding protein Musashi homolog 2-like [Camellia sinensis]